MKLLLSLLVVGNLLALAWLQGWLGPLTGDARDPARIDRQINADLLGIDSIGRAGPVSGAPSPPAGTSSGAATAAGSGSPIGAASGRAAGSTTPSGSAAPASVEGAAEGNGGTGAAPPAGSQIPRPATGAGAYGAGAAGATFDNAAWMANVRTASCIEIGPMEEGATLRLQAAIDAAFPGLPMEIRRTEEPNSYWVYLPPAPNAADGPRRLAEVRDLGVTDVFLVSEGPFKGAISLGVYRQGALAQARQRTLADIGVRSPRVSPRSAGTRSSLRVLSVPPQLPAEFLALQASFPEAAARLCPGAIQDAAAR